MEKFLAGLSGVFAFVETAAPFVTHVVENASKIGASAGQLKTAITSLDVNGSLSAAEALMAETGITMGDVTAVLDASKGVVIPTPTATSA